ncbi:Trehalose and maltose hydrolase (possible phosphorylase) [Desulfonatronum thiosulfatophilum]|uniref:Trehalose and maltose hydrolase (Possible phosphorylase) n=1 Tax=Desulfonatronum thiosulfatophilum TaxID=617002 RepID=A0A1G6CJX1_9BACT|nr:glycosyl hydrolase family 65 protein [Desulfonatronum thiosulfatophilum]SDB33151.1 Trehalose and maltose hydrolase (possible phosphorylase) [Desulfonatronum thiosulfatophilum]
MTVWSLIYNKFDPEQEKLREALCTLGNGYFAARGAASEAQSDDTHYPGTYLAGGYNRLQTEMQDRFIENEDLVNLPNWLSLSFRYADQDWFHLKNVEILEYRQELDMKRGILHRNVRFRDSQGKRTRIKEQRLVHMAQPHLAALRLVFSPENWSGEVEFRSALDGRVINGGVDRYRDLNNVHLEPVESDMPDAETIRLKVRTNQSRLEIAQAARTTLCGNGEPLDIRHENVVEPKYVAGHFLVQVGKGMDIRVEKIVSLTTSRDKASSECRLEAMNHVRSAGDFESLRNSHILAWKHLWRRFDIDFEEKNPPIEDRTGMILHLHTFHLLQTTSLHTMDLDVGVPSRGWHGEAYRGHIFWDELFIFPFLNLRVPEITRSLLMYRYRRIDQARAAAAEAGYRGAMYPWQSGSNGREESQRLHLNPKSGRWIPDHSRRQRHVNAAIVYNIRDYYQATQDMEFLSFHGAEMVLEIARFWSSIATYNSTMDRYEILGVMGPDEYHEAYPDSDAPGLHNNAYTNVMAAWVLNEALEMLEVLPEDRRKELCEKLALGEEELKRWRHISRRMRLVFHGDGIISQFEGYDALQEFDWEGYREKYGDIQRLDRILESEDDSPDHYKASKQADVLMLFYLFSADELRELFQQLDYPFDDETIQKNIDYYIQRTSHGSTLSQVVHSWVLLRRNRDHSWKLFSEALESDISDVQGGTTPEGIHLGAMAGTVNMIQVGYTGLETRGDVLWFDPCLPSDLARMEMHIHYRGHNLRIEIFPQYMKITACRARKNVIKIGYKGTIHELDEGKTLEIAFRRQ